MSGIELLEHLTEVAPNVPVVCMTGRHQPDLEERPAPSDSFFPISNKRTGQGTRRNWTLVLSTSVDP